MVSGELHAATDSTDVAIEVRVVPLGTFTHVLRAPQQHVYSLAMHMRAWRCSHVYASI